MDSKFVDYAGEDDSENRWAAQRPLHRTRLVHVLKSMNLPCRMANQEKPRGLRDRQIMVDASQEREREREQVRRFEREMMALSGRFSNTNPAWDKQPSPSRGSHRLLHRRQS